MKKAIVLGVTAFFAINIATVQQAKAQDKKDVKSEKVELKQDKAVKPEAVQLQKAEKEQQNAIKDCDKKGCDKKDKGSCCEKNNKISKDAKVEGSKATNDKMKPKEIKVEKRKESKSEVNKTDK